jgi:molybdopterin converting factor small subunit
MSVNVSLLLFASAKDRIGGQNEIKMTIDRVWENSEVLKKHICLNVLEQLSDLEPVLALAINEEYVTDSDKQILLNDNDVLALIPPITGG